MFSVYAKTIDYSQTLMKILPKYLALLLDSMALIETKLGLIGTLVTAPPSLLMVNVKIRKG